VTAALEAAEQRGLVHRDLKPGNLMLVSRGDEKTSASTQRGGYSGNVPGIVATTEPARRGGRRRAQRNTIDVDQRNEKLVVKVIDFGVAKAVAEKTNAMALTHGGFVGTPAFASPEQFTNAPVDVRSDIYSLGVTLWFLLTGHMLFSGRTIEEIQEARRSKPLPIDQLKAAHVPRRLISLLTSMLAIEPAARPAGARELARRLQAIRVSITGRGKTAVRLALAAAIVVLATIVAVRLLHSSSTKATPAAIPEKSIAVLPLENLSRDPDNAYFAEGIQDEILTRLAKIAGLKVISRTSTQRYQSKPGNLAEIAKQLGVANVLEGSVQKAADQVRVNVQLINAQTDSHLWAETYDQKLTNILAVESEIAKRVADSLQAKLSGREEQALAVKPTNNPEAYDAYLRGLALDARSLITSYSSVPVPLKAADFYEQAVQLDPNFAIAWARLSRAHSVVYPMFTDATTAIAHAARRDAAKRALERAQKLEPNSPETLLALGYYQFWVLRDYRLAKATFSRVSKMLPGSSDVPYALGQVARHEGHWDQSIGYFEQSLALDPRNVEFLFHIAWTYSMLRQFPAALKLYDRALDITPNDPDLMAIKACVYQGQGNLQEAAQLLVEANAQTKSQFVFRSKITQLRLERNYDEAVRLLQTRLTQSHFDSQDDKGWHQVTLALMRSLAGDAAGAKTTAEQARIELEQLFRDKQSDPWLPFLAAWLSQAYAVMGEKDSALKEAERAIVLLPQDKTRLTGPALEENLALIQTIFGENSRAISTLAYLLQTPYNGELYNPTPLTPALLRLDPFWDPLRADPAFQKLCEEKQP
jgi:TolB-like protein/regulator of sirC expression with transglutaminase-like and TPR domain